MCYRSARFSGPGMRAGWTIFPPSLRCVRVLPCVCVCALPCACLIVCVHVHVYAYVCTNMRVDAAVVDMHFCASI